MDTWKLVSIYITQMIVAEAGKWPGGEGVLTCVVHYQNKTILSAMFYITYISGSLVILWPATDVTISRISGCPSLLHACPVIFHSSAVTSAILSLVAFLTSRIVQFITPVVADIANARNFVAAVLSSIITTLSIAGTPLLCSTLFWLYSVTQIHCCRHHPCCRANGIPPSWRTALWPGFRCSSTGGA